MIPGDAADLPGPSNNKERKPMTSHTWSKRRLLSSAPIKKEKILKEPRVVALEDRESSKDYTRVYMVSDGAPAGYWG